MLSYCVISDVITTSVFYSMTTRDLLRDAADRAATYLEGLPSRGVAPSAEAVAALAHFDEPLPEHPRDASRVLSDLDEYGSPGTGASAGGRYFGFVIGATLPAALAANMLATSWDQNAGLVDHLADHSEARARSRSTGCSTRCIFRQRPRRGLRHRRDDGELHRSRRRATRAARARGLGCRGAGTLRRSAAQRGRRRRSARHRAQGARHARTRPRPRHARARRRSGTHARRHAAAARRPHDSSACRRAT